MKNIYIINLIIISIIIIFIIYNLYLYYNKEKFTTGTLCQIDKLADEFCTGKKLVDIGTNWIEIPISEKKYENEVEITNQSAKNLFIQMLKVKDPPTNLNKQTYDLLVTQNNLIVTENSFIKVTKEGETIIRKYIPQSAYGYHWIKIGLDKKIYDDEEEIIDSGFKNIFKMIIDSGQDPPVNLNLQVYDYLVNRNKVYVGKKNFVIIDKDDGSRHKYIPNDERSGVCWWVPLDNKKSCREICPTAAKEQIISKPIQIETNYKNTNMLLTERQRLTEANTEIAESIPEIIENTQIAQQDLIDNTILQRSLETQINNSVTPLIWKNKSASEIVQTDIELSLVGLNEKLIEKGGLTLQVDEYIILTDTEWENILWNNYQIVTPQKIWKKIGITPPNTDVSNLITNIPTITYERFIVNGEDPISVTIDDETELYNFPIINRNSYVRNQNNTYYVPFIIYRPKYNNYVKIQNKYFVPTLWGNCSKAQKDILIDNIKLNLESENYIDRSLLEQGKLVYKNKDIDNLCLTNNYGRQGDLDDEYITFNTLNQQLNIDNTPNKDDISQNLKNFRNSKVVSNNNDNLVTMDQNYQVEMKNSIINPTNRNYYNKTEYDGILTNWNTEKNQILQNEDSKVTQNQNANCAYTVDQISNWSTKNLITPNDDVTLSENVGSWGRIGDKENTSEQNLYTLNSHIISENTQKNELEQNCFIKKSTINNWNTVPTNLNWKNIGRFQPSNKIEYTDTNLQNLVDILKQKTKMTQIEFNSLGLTNTINQNHFVIVDNNFYVPIVDPVILNNINSGEGTTTWVYNDTTNPDYMLLSDYKTKYDNLNNFNCAYTNSFADQHTNSTITPSDISGLSDVTGTWGKIANASELSSTTNHLCPDSSRTCDIPNQLYVQKSEIDRLESTLQSQISNRDENCGMTNSEIQSLSDTFEKNGNSWGRITAVQHIDSENGGLPPYDTNTNINTQKTNLNCYYSLNDVNTWNNVLNFDNIKYGKIGTNSDEYMLISDIDTKITQDCKVTNSDWNSGVFIKETPYGENVFKNFQNTNYGVIKDSQGNLTNDYITNTQCNNESQQDVAALEATQDSTADKDQYRTGLNTVLTSTVNQLKSASEQLQQDIETARSQHSTCLNDLKDGNSFKMSYDDYIKSKTYLNKLKEYKQHGIQQGNIRGQAWNNKYSKTLDNGSYIYTDDPSLAIDCYQQSISKPVVWHNVEIIADTTGLNDITQDGGIGQWFSTMISQNPNKTSFTEAEINAAGFNYDQLNINDIIIINSKYYKLKLEFNNPLINPLNSCVDINKSCKSNDNIITPQQYAQALQSRKDQLNTNRTSCISNTPIGDIKLKGYISHMNNYGNKYNDGNDCKRFDSVNNLYTNLDTCSNDSNGIERQCKVNNPNEVLVDCCQYSDSNTKCLPNTNKSTQELSQNTNVSLNDTIARSFRNLPKSSIVSRPGISNTYADSYDMTRNRLIGKCEINSPGDHCLKIAGDVPIGLVWKKISKNITHQTTNKMDDQQILGLNGFLQIKQYPDIVNLTIDEYNTLIPSEKTYIQQNNNKWIAIPGQSQSVYIYDEKFNNIVNCKDSNSVDLSLYTTPKPGTNNYCDGTATCVSETNLTENINCLNRNYEEEINSCSNITDRCDYKKLVNENCKTNSKSATGLSWYVITDLNYAPTDQTKRLNKNNKFTKLTNKLKQIYIQDDSQTYIHIEYLDSGVNYSDTENYLNKLQYQEYILNQLTESLTSDHYIVISHNSQTIYFKAIAAWSHSEDYGGYLSLDSYVYPALNSCNRIGILDYNDCNECPSGYYRDQSYDKRNHLIGHPQYDPESDNYQYSEKGYQIIIWKASNIRNRIQQAISSSSNSTTQINNILDIIEDSSVNSDSEITDPAASSSQGTKGLLTLSTYITRATRTKISTQYFPSGGKNMIMYISGYINVNKEGVYILNVKGTKFGYHIWINGIPQLYKNPSSNKPELETGISILPNNFTHFEAILYNGNSSVGNGNYFEVSLTNEEDSGKTPLILNQEAIYPWCGTCIKCGKCTVPGQVRENCGIDGGDEYSDGVCNTCRSCNSSGVLY